MFGSLLKLLQAPSTSNQISTNALQEAEQIISNTPLSNNTTLEIVTAYLAGSHNTFIQIIFQIIKDNPYAIFLVVVLSVFALTIILRLGLYIFSNPKNMKRRLGRRILKILLSSKFIWTGLLLGVLVGVDVLHLSPPIAKLIKGCILSILLWLCYIITQKIISIYSRGVLLFRTQGTKLKFFKNRNIFIVLSRTAHAICFLIFITILLGIWGVELAPILAGLGIVGLVVGLALQDSLSHIVGGVSLMLDETYTEGDYVILDNDNEGIIFQIGYRSTKLRTFDEEIIIIPNGVLSKMIITNLSQPVKRTRVNLFFKTYAEDAPPHIIKEILVQAAKNTTNVLKYPEPYVFFLAASGTLLSFRLSFYTASPLTKLSTTDAVQQEIVKLFFEKKIRFGIEETLMHIQHDTPSLSNLQPTQIENKSE